MIPTLFQQRDKWGVNNNNDNDNDNDNNTITNNNNNNNNTLPPSTGTRQRPTASDSVLQNTRFLTHLKFPGAYTSRRRVAQILRRQFEEPDQVEIN